MSLFIIIVTGIVTIAVIIVVAHGHVIGLHVALFLIRILSLVFCLYISIQLFYRCCYYG